MKKTLSLIVVLIICALNFGFVKNSAVDLNKFKVDAEKNAEIHNNKGVNWLEERYYFGAIKEFEMAIQLNPNTQATAVYYSNLGRTYIIIGYPAKAKMCFERALIQNPINFEYYLNLLNCYKKLGILKPKLAEYKSKKINPLNQIMVGLIYIELGQTSTGIITLDDFCHKEPDLIITKAVRNYIKQKAPKKKYTSKY
ncbi:MAG: hypothetical protein PHV37_04615 [Candidatus Gastranaerophilales bacterium]|nr:hypothetical protein [Candidatus Gastranaerophilales bacterium]